MYEIAHRKGYDTVNKIAHLNATPGMSSHRLGFARATCVLLAVLAGYILWVASPALAGQTRVLTGVFGAATSNPANPYPLSSASGVAVDTESHDVYVVDTEGHRVEKFDSAGHFLLMFGKEVNRTTGGNLCTAASGDVCQTGVSGSSPGAFERPEPVAVDNSGVFGQQGDVYIGDYNTGLVSKFNAEGELISSWGNNSEGHAKNGPANGQLNGSNATGAVKGPFGIVEGLATDPSGNIWVKASGGVFEFRPTSSFVTSWSGDAGPIAVDIDPENLEEHIYTGIYETLEYKSTGTVIGRVLHSGFGGGLTIDQTSNELYSSETTQNREHLIHRYSASCHPEIGGEGEYIFCTPLESIGTNNIRSEIIDVAIDSQAPIKTLYATEPGGEFNGIERTAQVPAFSIETVPDVVTAKATDFMANSTTLAGSINPAGIELEAGLAGCRFEWGEHGAGEPQPYGHVAPCDKTSAQIGAGPVPVEVHANISGLEQGHVYHFRLVAGNHNQVNQVLNEPSLGADFTFGPPSLESTSAVSVGANSAVIQAQISPNNVDTRIRAEYGTEAGVYDQSTPEVDLGSGGSSQLASIQLSGLVPGTVYHYRFVAENALGEGGTASLSPDRAFTTQKIGVFSLPDGRAWELVSPADKHGAGIAAISEEGVIQAAAEGDAATYITSQPTEDEPAGSANGIQVLSRRTATGWVSQDIAEQHDASTGASVGGGPEYPFFSVDLSHALFRPYGGFVAQISPEASEQTPYLRTDFASGEVESPCLASCYRPLVTGAEGVANVPAETVFAPTCATESVCGPQSLGASLDLSHVVLESLVPLVEGAPVGRESTNEGSLYEWTAGKLSLISILPDGQPAPAINDGLQLGGDRVTRNAISSDGSRVIWSDGEGDLYVRDITNKETVQVGAAGTVFQLANSDVSKILFTEHGDLRQCDVVESEGPLHCDTSDLTPAVAGESPDVVGIIPGASEDGTNVYFAANGMLQNNGVPVAGAQAGECESKRGSATCNLYVRHEGTIKLVGELSSDDNPDWASGVGVSGISGLTARVSPDGHWLAFMSDQSLTGYDNRDSVTGKPDEEVYLYDAVGNGGAGKLVCASCDPTGARPRGREFEDLEITLTFGRVGFAGDQGIAANVQAWTPFSKGEASYQSRYLSDSGRLFFNSTDALVPQDSNGTGDVYEYEPPGIGDCTTASVTYGEDSGGCVGLISSGTSKEESGFMDASEDGSNVFFESRGRLLPSDTDTSTDLYDARVGGGFPEPQAPPVCEGDACQSPIAAPEDPTPGSLTFQGPGNQTIAPLVSVESKQKAKPLTRSQKLAKALKACKRVRSKRSEAQCAQRARERYGKAAKTGRATTKKKGR